MLGDVLRLSWSISLGSLLPSSLRLRPSKLSRSEGDCGRGSSCCRRRRTSFFSFSLLPLHLGPPLHKIISPNMPLYHVMNTIAQAHLPCGDSPPLPTFSASVVSLPGKLHSFLKCPSQAPSPHPQLNPNPGLPPAHIHPLLISFHPINYTCQKPVVFKKTTPAFSF